MEDSSGLAPDSTFLTTRLQSCFSVITMIQTQPTQKNLFRASILRSQSKLQFAINHFIWNITCFVLYV